MSKEVASQPNEFLDSKVVYESKWVTIRLDHYRSNGGQTLEYPLAVRSDSAIILVRQGDKFVLSDPQLRPGVKERTLDFPGGRIDGADPLEAAKNCVAREFQLEDVALPELVPLTERPLFVDSAFSSQKVYGYTLELPEALNIEGTRYSANALLEELNCLQCRSMLLEWLRITQ